MHLSRRAGRLAALALPLIAATPAVARDFTAGSLVIENPWARATPGGAQIGGGYLTIENKGSTADRLLGGSLAASAGFELHAMSMAGGVMTMRPTGPLEIPAGGKLALEPSAKHIMFTGLKRPLRQGETIAGTLTFDHAGTVPVSFDVEAIGARGPAAAGAAAQPPHPMSGMDMK